MKSNFKKKSALILICVMIFSLLESNFIFGTDKQSKSAEITVYFTAFGDDVHDSDEDGNVHNYEVGGLQTWVSREAVTVERGSTAGQAIKKSLSEHGLQANGIDSNYIKSINTPWETRVGEFTNGAKSGWEYSVNGARPQLGVQEYTLEDGDEIVLPLYG